MILFLIFTFIPFIYGIYISLTKWDLFSDPQFVGLANFKTILFDADSSFYRMFWLGLKNTFIFVVFSVPLCIIVPLIIAALLAQIKTAKNAYGSFFYIPTLFAISAVMIIFNFIFGISYGPINEWFNSNTNFLQTQPYAWISIIAVTVWWTMGTNLIIYESAITNVSQDIIESAQIDGAGKIRIFFEIIIPNISFQLLYTTITTTIAQFNIYGQPLMLTDGGPNESTTVLIMQIRKLAFETGYSKAGIASAMAVMLGLVILFFSAIQIVFSRRRNK